VVAGFLLLPSPLVVPNAFGTMAKKRQERRLTNERLIPPANKYLKIVIVRLDRTMQNLLKRLDSPIKSGNDKYESFKCLFAGLIDN
jgi:hypothetical protein